MFFYTGYIPKVSQVHQYEVAAEPLYDQILEEMPSSNSLGGDEIVQQGAVLGVGTRDRIRSSSHSCTITRRYGHRGSCWRIHGNDSMVHGSLTSRYVSCVTFVTCIAP